MNHADFTLKSTVSQLREVRPSRGTSTARGAVREANPTDRGAGRRRFSPHPTLWQFLLTREGKVMEALAPILATSQVSITSGMNGISVGLPTLDEHLRLMLVAAIDGRPQQDLLESVRGITCRLLVMMHCEPGFVRVEILDLDAAIRFPNELFAELFGLTATECQIVDALTQGDTLREYAENYGVSRNTARTHLKSVFMKTRTHRQADLVRMAQLLCMSYRDSAAQSSEPANHPVSHPLIVR